MLKDLQRALIRALTSNRPVETLRREKASLSPEERALVDRVGEEQFILTGLIVRKLRFERICRGDQEAEAWFARDPERFIQAFQAYNEEVPCTETFPRGEAAAFQAWRKRKNP